MTLHVLPSAQPVSAGVSWFRSTWARIAILILVVAGTVAAHRWYGNRNHFFDLKIYTEAMRWWHSGHPLYEYAEPDATQGQLGYTYPPFAAVIMKPLALLNLGSIIAIYVILAAAAFAVSIWWLTGPVAQRFSLPRWFAFGLMLPLASALEPVREAFSFGQVNFLLWVLVLFDLLVLLPGGSRFVGVGIGLATAIKLIPGIFIVYLLVTRRFRAAAVAAGTALVACALAAAIAPRESWTFWTSRIFLSEGVGKLAYEFNQSVNGVLARLAWPELPNRVLWIVLVLPILGYGLWRARRAAAAGDELAGLTLAGIAGSLVSPVTWAHHIFWVVPALVVMLAARPHDVASGLRRPAARYALAGISYLTITMSVVAIWSFYLHQPGGVVAFVMSNWYVWLMIALLALLPIRVAERGLTTDMGVELGRARA